MLIYTKPGDNVETLSAPKMTNEKVTELQYAKSALGPVTPSTARTLIFGFYTEMFGASIREETPRSIRLKIIDLERQMRGLDRQSHNFILYARQAATFERVCYLLEAMGHH